MNPLQLEYTRSRLHTFLVVLSLAFTGAIVDYFLALHQRVSQQQAMLHSAAEDLDHQLQPLVHLLNVFKADIELSLAEQPSSPLPLSGALWAMPGKESQQLSGRETSMLANIAERVTHTQRTSLSIQKVSYLSFSGFWYSFQGLRTATEEQLAAQYWQLIQQRHAMAPPQLHINRLEAEPSVYILSVPIKQERSVIGELIIHFDLPNMLKSVANAQSGSALHLINENGKTLISVLDATQVIPDGLTDLHSKENIRTLRHLPVSLLVEPNAVISMWSVIFSFFLHFFLYLLVLGSLWFYSRRRFKNKVLGPFKRLMVHIERLQRGDAQGVRRAPSEWVRVFHQIEQLRNGAQAKKDDN